MDAVLIRYGQVWLQGASGQELGAKDDREPIPRIPWTEITVEPMQPQQPALIPAEPTPRPIRDARKRNALPPSHPTPVRVYDDIPFDTVAR